MERTVEVEDVGSVKVERYEVWITRTSLYEVDAPDPDTAIDMALDGMDESPGGETTGVSVYLNGKDVT